MAKYKNSSGGLGRFWAILLTLILIAGIVFGVVYRKQVAVMWGDLTRYFKRVDEEVPKDDGDGTTDGTDDEANAGEVEKRDNMVVSDVESGGLTFAMVPLAASDLSATAESGFTITATVSPSQATDKTLDWTVEWADSSDFWVTAFDAVVTDYVTITPTADGSNVATVECLKDFGAQIVVKSTARSNPDAYATCTLDYYARVIGATLRFTSAGGETDFAMSQGNFYQTIIVGSDVIEYEEGMANVPITNSICGEGVYTDVQYLTSNYTIPLDEENATKTEVFAYEHDFYKYLDDNSVSPNPMGLMFTEHRKIGSEGTIEAFDYQYLGLWDNWNGNPTTRTLYPTFADYKAQYGAKYLSLVNAYEEPAIIFKATYQDDMNDIRFGLALSYQKDYFEIPVESVEVDNTGAVL